MPEGPSRNDLSKAEYYLKLFEQQVEKARGRPLLASNEQREALKRIKDLKEKFPADPDVEALFQRARDGLMGSKGGGFQITPEMLAYRDREAQRVSALGKIADESWAALRAAQQDVLDAFPAPDPAEADPEQLTGRAVVLEGLRYPDDQFQDSGVDYVFVGDPQRGMYFVRLSGRAWHTAYGALQRFRDLVSGELPAPWTVAGKISGVALLVPQAGKERTASAVLGWVVEPAALYLPGRALALPAAEGEERGRFAGEDQAASLREGAYTVKELREEADPIEVLRVFATAIKEKNWDLFTRCVDPSWLATPTALSHLRYYWNNNQERFRALYVHVEPEAVQELIVLRGEKVDNDEAFFLTPEQIAEMKARAEPLLEQALVTVRRYDERGRQVGSPNPIFLRREEGKGWRVYGGFPL